MAVFLTVPSNCNSRLVVKNAILNGSLVGVVVANRILEDDEGVRVWGGGDLMIFGRTNAMTKLTNPIMMLVIMKFVFGFSLFSDIIEYFAKFMIETG